MHPNVIAATSTITKLWKKPRCPSTDKWMKKMWSIYTMDYYSAIRKDEYPPFASTWMEQEGIMLSEISQGERQLLYGFTSMWNIRNSMEDHRGREGKLQGKKSERETSHERLWTPGNKLRTTEGGGVGGRGN